MRRSSIIKKASLAYGTCCSLISCAILLLMACGVQSPLGRSIAYLLLAVSWSGVPLLPLSAFSLNGRGVPLIVCGAALLLSLAPAVICLFFPLARVFLAVGDPTFGLSPSIAFLLAPVAISAILLLLLISRCFPGKGATASGPESGLHQGGKGNQGR